MKFGDREQCSESKVKRKNSKYEQSKHGLQKNLEVESGAISLLLIMLCIYWTPSTVESFNFLNNIA